jgi:hypothetical protein
VVAAETAETFGLETPLPHANDRSENESVCGNVGGVGSWTFYREAILGSHADALKCSGGSVSAGAIIFCCTVTL